MNLNYWYFLYRQKVYFIPKIFNYKLYNNHYKSQISILNMSKTYTYEEIKQDKTKFDEVFDFIKKYGSHTMAIQFSSPRCIILLRMIWGWWRMRN